MRNSGLSFTRGIIGTAIAVVLVFVVILTFMKLRYGMANEAFPFSSTAPLMPDGALEVVVELPEPPGNIAVSADGRVFFTYHPEAQPDLKVFELVKGRPEPFPDAEFQHERGNGEPYFQTPLALRIDDQQRLWVLDPGFYGLKQPRLLAFDIKTRAVVHRWDMPRSIAGFGSYANDFHVSRGGRYIYIADVGSPAIIVFDTCTGQARRVLENHYSVANTPYIVSYKGRNMTMLGGLMHMNPGIDPIALDHQGEWLYYGAMSGGRLFRVRTADLVDPRLSPEALGARVEDYGPKNQSDGISIDSAGNVYLTGIGQGTIDLLTPDRQLHTYLQDSRLRWPDGMSFGPGGWIYLTDSDFPDIGFQPHSHIRASAPYYIFRFRARQMGRIGH